MGPSFLRNDKGIPVFSQIQYFQLIFRSAGNKIAKVPQRGKIALGFCFRNWGNKFKFGTAIVKYLR